MPRKRKGVRVLGPYYEPARKRYRVVSVDAKGKQTPDYFKSERQANQFKQKLEQGIASNEHTTETALELYERYLIDVKGNKPQYVPQTLWAVRKIFRPPGVALWSLRERDIKQRYEDLVNVTKSASTHRGCLAQTKTFLRWCVEQGWLTHNPAEGVRGVGKVNRRKEQLSYKNARKWYATALKLATEGNDRAVGALCACLLGMRASEIVSRRVKHIEDWDEPADTMVIRDAKTPAGDRDIPVDEDLRPFLIERCFMRGPEELLFPPDRETRTGYRDRDWPRDSVHHVCDAAGVPRVTAHSMRGLLADISLRRVKPEAAIEVAKMLGHDDLKVTKDSYAKPGAAEEGARRAGLAKLKGEG